MRRIVVLLGALILGGLVFWLTKREEDVGEAFCDTYQIDTDAPDDPGEDVDERAT